MPKKKIKKMIHDMESSKLIIPSFQRDYVWEMEQIEDLFDSLMRRIPINSILIWNLESKLFKDLQFEFYKFFSKYDSERSNNELTTLTRDEYKVVIDGQQRLTSLYIGFMGSFSKRKPYSRKNPNSINMIERFLYLDLTASAENLQDKDFVLSNPESNLYKFKFLSDDEVNRKTDPNIPHTEPIFLDLNNHHWFKVNKLGLISTQDITNWQTKYALKDEEKNILNDLHNLYHELEVLETIEWDNDDVNEAITVFVRYNSKGTVLTPAQVIQSLLSVYWTNVRKDFKELIKQVKNFGFFIDVNNIIKALLSVYTENPQNNIKRIKKEVVEKFNNNWSAFSKGVSEVFAELKRLGFTDKNLTSFNAIIPIIYYKLHKSNINKDEWKQIGFWLMHALLVESFSGNSDAAIKNSLKPFLNFDFKKNEFPKDEIIKELKEDSKNVTIEDLMWIQKEDKRASLLMSILLPEKWEKITELDHLHPIKIFKKNPYVKEWERANSIVNLQPLRGTENSEKNDKPLERWINETYPLSNDINENSQEDKNRKRAEYLNSVYIPSNLSLKFEDRVELWSEREKEFKKRLEKIFN